MAGARSVVLLALLMGAAPLASTAEAQEPARRERPRQAEPAPRVERPAAREKPPAEQPARRAEPRQEPRRAEPARKPAQAPKSTGEPELRRRKS